MALRLVHDDLDVSFEIPLQPDVMNAFEVQLQRAAYSTLRPAFENMLGRQLEEMLDADLRPPTGRQMAYAIAIARTLGVALPAEALQHRGSMYDFLNRHAPLFKSRA